MNNLSKTETIALELARAWASQQNGKIHSDDLIYIYEKFLKRLYGHVHTSTLGRIEDRMNEYNQLGMVCEEDKNMLIDDINKIIRGDGHDS